ncbi:hypothetical protein C8R44DRAFT_865416 [Mycena epipterygia]|nr:hypothetical protein C8R44DRAFT_865416 [Mycena epipterygia]
MPILPSRQRLEQASESGPSAGVTVGATFGGIVLFSLLVFLVFLKRRRDQRNLGRARRNGLLFHSRSSDSEDAAEEKQTHSSHPDSESPYSQSERLLPSPTNLPRPYVPPLTIPLSPNLLPRSTFLDHHATSAVTSACMNSSDSAHFQFSVSSHSATLHAGPSKHRPSPTLPSAFHYGMETSDVTAAAARRPLIMNPCPRQSVHPITGPHLATETARTRMGAMMELPSPLMFILDTEEDGDGDTMSVSPISKLSEELAAFIETIPPGEAKVQFPETPTDSGHASLLQIVKARKVVV